ncbi:MAG TPA: hypothetical protein VH478_07070 [Trebonia sp.]|jgi:hypothetical protein|nr:hypothetical protein [Trebonia sp.]
MNIAELDMESAELLPDRQALCSWKWSPCGHEYTYTSFSYELSINFTQVTSYWG